MIGPNADSPEALMGCYSFVNHVLAHHPEVPLGLEIPSLAEALRAELPDAAIDVVTGCEVDRRRRERHRRRRRRRHARPTSPIVVVGDRAGLFGRGTVGEGNDVDDLELPGPAAPARRGGRRAPVCRRSWSCSRVARTRSAGRSTGPAAPAAVLQAFFPGEEGGAAISEILSGRTAPSGRLPVSLPRSAGAQPYTYLHPILGGPSEITSADSTPALPFGHGLTYTTFEHARPDGPSGVRDERRLHRDRRRRSTPARAPGSMSCSSTRGTCTRASPAPSRSSLGYARVALEAGERTVVQFQVPSARLAFTDRRGIRIVEPGDIELWVGGSCDERETRATMRLTGPVHEVTAADGRTVSVEVAAPVRA